MLSTSWQNNIILVTEYGYVVEIATTTDSGRRWRWGRYDKNRYIAAGRMKTERREPLQAEGFPERGLSLFQGRDKFLYSIKCDLLLVGEAVV